MAGTVTGLVVQKRNPKRVNVYVDGAYAFPLDLSVVMKRGLKSGQPLSDEEIEYLTAADDVEKAYNRALNLLSYRPRSVAEVQRNLQRKKVAFETIEAVVARLTQSGMLDDAAFARFWVENRTAFSPRSGRLMSYELRQKGVAGGDIEVALPSEDGDSAKEAAMRRARSLASLDYETFRKKLLPYLQRRGFGYETASEAVESAWQESRSSDGERIATGTAPA
jgi:regulatory protein